MNLKPKEIATPPEKKRQTLAEIKAEHAKAKGWS